MRPWGSPVMGQGPRKIIISAAHHANEWITAPVALKFARELAQALEAEYGIDPETALADTRAFLDQMRTMGILIED